MEKDINEILFNPTPNYHFSRGFNGNFIYVDIDCPECKEPLRFKFSWEEVLNAVNKNITEFYENCLCGKRITFNVDKKLFQGFTAESVLEAFEK